MNCKNCGHPIEREGSYYKHSKEHNLACCAKVEGGLMCDCPRAEPRGGV